MANSEERDIDVNLVFLFFQKTFFIWKMKQRNVVDLITISSFMDGHFESITVTYMRPL